MSNASEAVQWLQRCRVKPIQHYLAIVGGNGGSKEAVVGIRTSSTQLESAANKSPFKRSLSWAGCWRLFWQHSKLRGRFAFLLRHPLFLQQCLNFNRRLRENHKAAQVVFMLFNKSLCLSFSPTIHPIGHTFAKANINCRPINWLPSADGPHQ